MNRTALGFVLGLGAWLSACGSPIVGAECLHGYTACDGVCVDLESDPAHCGACGNDCGGLECREGMCVSDGDGGPSGALDGGTLDGGTGGTVRPPGQSSGSSGFPIRPDGGVNFPDPGVEAGCGIGETDCGGTCAHLPSDPDHCGACGAACVAGELCSGGSCTDKCDPPLSRCGGACIDLQTDPRNCGGCGVVCASGLCEAGMCADVVPGHLVVIGHDYASSPSAVGSTMKRIAGNALLLAPGAPVRTLVYHGTASDASVRGVVDAIDAVAASNGRSWQAMPVDEDELTERLLAADALIIHAQHGASDAELDELGQRWGLALAQFLLRSGVVVLFETSTDANTGTFRLLEPAGLFAAESRELTSGRMTIVAPGDSVATRTTLDYQSRPATVRFNELAEGGRVVVEDSAGEAVVVHRVAVP